MRGNVLKDLFNFIKKPNYTPIIGLTFVQKLKLILNIYILTFISALLSGLLIYLLVKSDIVNNNELPLQLANKDYAKWGLIFGLLFPPILEELACRLPLIKFNRTLTRVSLSLIIGILMYTYFAQYLWHSKNIIIINLLAYLFPIIVAFPIYIILSFVKLIPENKWNSNFPLVFYSFTTIFALLHLLSLSIPSKHYFLLPIIISPYFILGISLGYIRVKLGILYSIFFHLIFNAPIIFKKLFEIHSK